MLYMVNTVDTTAQMQLAICHIIYWFGIRNEGALRVFFTTVSITVFLLTSIYTPTDKAQRI